MSDRRHSLLSMGVHKNLTPRPGKNHTCLGCEFKTKTCGSIGPVDSPFVIVGESPGKREVAYGRPFIGESGALLKKILMSSGYSIDNVEPYITNAIKCYPGDEKNPTSLKRACHSCRANLIGEVAAYPREVILALGNGAVWSLTGEFSTKITRARGQIFPSALARQGIVASVHPAFLLRGGGSMNKFKSDIALAAERIRGIQRPQYKDSEHVVLWTVDDFMDIVKRLEYTIWWHKALGLGAVDLAGDIETSGFSALEDRMLCHAFGWEDTLNYVIPEGAFRDSDYLYAIKDFMEWDSDEVHFVWHNGKFDIQFFWALDPYIDARVDEDTMLLSYALDENKGLHDLEQVSNDAIGAPNWKGMLDEHRPTKKSSYALIPRDILYKYAGKDIAATIQTFRVLSPKVERDEHLKKAYHQVMIPACDLLGRMETNGIKQDLEQIRYNRERLAIEMTQVQKDFDAYTMDLCGQTFNINSPAQIATLLYDILEIPTIKRDEKSTAKPVLESLGKHTAIDFILKFRKLSKKKGTYVDNILPRMKKNLVIRGHIKRDGRVHATFLIHGTVTGRLASRNPNKQNTPRDPEIRGQDCADDGHVFIEVDLNQAELRCLAERSGDPDLMEIYLDDSHPGLHHEVSVTLFGEGYTGEDKMRAKAVNFGIVYGRTGSSIADAFDMEPAEGERWVTGWAQRFPVAWEYIQQCRAAPLQGRTLITPFGRKRRFGIVSRANAHSVQNEASNFPFQSIASDITLVANGRCIKDPRYKGLPVNIIHDAGLHQVINNPDAIDLQAALITHYMESEAPKWGLSAVPFKAEAKVGTHWGKLKEYKIQDTYNFNLT